LFVYSGAKEIQVGNVY